MRIGKITFDGYNNYGNTLQNFALQEYLKQFCDDVETIWHSPHEKLSEFWKWGNKEEIKFILNHGSFRKDIKSGVRAWELARRVRGMDFAQRYIKIRYDVENLESIIQEYDFFVVGSDQVWNPNNPDLSTAFLQFAPPDKRISYAASIGAQYIPDVVRNQYVTGINSMRSISVRENRASEIIYELTGRAVDVVLDPVFCIEESKWRSISLKPYWLKNNNYIFSYFLGNVPDYVSRVAKDEDMEMITCFDKEHIERYIISPEEWLYLISNASYVFTDSFHATAFSIIFKRNFLVFPRNESDQKKQMLTRIDSLLRTFSMEDRFYRNDAVLSNNRTDNVSEDVIKSEKVKSDKFMRDSFLIT